MPRKACCWTRKMELQLVEFVQRRECIWRPNGNTNFHIKQKYKAYAEFASKIGKGFTARSVRDRWVNIRSTFNHNVRRVAKSKITAKSPEDIYVPCWPLWRPLQFLCESSKKEIDNGEHFTMQEPIISESTNIKNEDDSFIEIRQKPRKSEFNYTSNSKECLTVIDKLLTAMKPIVDGSTTHKNETYWFFGRHVTERLNSMAAIDAECASQEILKLLERWSYRQEVT